MGLFDFFKKKKRLQPGSEEFNRIFSKDEAGDLILIALNKLCDDQSTVEDAKNLIVSKGYSETQAAIIAEKANKLYLDHFANKKTQ